MAYRDWHGACFVDGVSGSGRPSYGTPVAMKNADGLTNAGRLCAKEMPLRVSGRKWEGAGGWTPGHDLPLLTPCKSDQKRSY